MFPKWPSCACLNFVPGHRQIWPVSTILDCSCYRFSLTIGGISSKLCICILIPFSVEICLSKKRFRSVDLYGRQTAILEIMMSPLLNIVTILSHLLRDYSSDAFETCLGYSSNGLVVHCQIWYWSVDRYGRLSAILDFSHYCTSSVMGRGILWKLDIWIPLSPLLGLPKNDSSPSINMVAWWLS